MAVDLSALIAELENGAAGALNEAAERMVAESNLRAPIDTGNLSESGQVTVHASPAAYMTATVANETPYASFQDQGTGGSTGNPWLTFQVKGGGWVKVHTTAPVPATRFWEDVMTADNLAENIDAALDTYLT